MADAKVSRNAPCPCGSGKKFKKCCLNRRVQSPPTTSRGFVNRAKSRSSYGYVPPITPPRSTPSPQQFSGAFDDPSTDEVDPYPEPPPFDTVPLLPVEIGLHYTYDEPFGTAEVTYVLPAGRPYILANGEEILNDDLEPGMRILLKDGAVATITHVKLFYDPPDPPEQREDGRVLSRVVGTIKHRGFATVDVTWPGFTATSSPDHPYYSVSREGYVEAQELKVGELLRTDDNLLAPVLSVSKPKFGMVDLYNVEVEHYHNYYVGQPGGSAVLVHNSATPGNYINTPAEGTKSRKLLDQDKLDAYATRYAEAVATNKPVVWRELAPELSRRQVKYVRGYARDQGYVKTAPVNEAKHADFTGHIYEHNGRVLDDVRLPENLWGVPKERQFRHLNKEIFGSSATPEGWTWHHHQESGRMQLVRYGIHSVTDHVGGESAGGWSTYR